MGGAVGDVRAGGGAAAVRDDAPGGAAAPTAADKSTNLWDFLMALVVCGALVVLVVVLIGKYDADTEKVTSVLGVAAPVLAAAFGVTLGYYSGNKAGEATGKKKGAQEVAGQVAGVVDTLDERIGKGVLTDLTETLESPEGLNVFRVKPGSDFSFPTSNVAEAREALGELRGIVHGARR